MNTVITASFAVLLALLTAVGCSSPFAGDTLAALPVAGQPTDADWERTVPLDLTVWMGNVNIPEAIVALDMETSHRSTPECHHGPSTSEPVNVRISALYSSEELFVSLQWPDRTRDLDLGTWEQGPGGWAARPGADDGIAILWESGGVPVYDEEGTGPGEQGDEVPFRCQYTCHMMEVDVYDGGTKMRMGMKAPDGRVMDLWRWRAFVTGIYGLADDMVVDEGGKRGDEGQVLPRENRTAEGAGPGVDSQGAGGKHKVPFYLVEAPAGRQSDVKADARWADGMWRLVLRRALDTSDPGDIIFTPGARIPFSVSVFDNTFSEHHVSDSSAVLVLWEGETSGVKRRNFDEPMDF